jgi:hypothetical protein
MWCGSRLTLATLVSLAIVAGCGYDTGGDLPAIVERATPAGAQLVTACGGSSGLIESPSHGCTFLAPGDGGAVTAAVARALREQRFDVACPRPGEITAVRDDVRVLAEVTQYGSIVASGGVANVYGSGYRSRGSQLIPAGSVAVKIGASRLVEVSAPSWRSRAQEGGHCAAALPKPNLVERCVNWWNGVGWRTGDQALSLRARPPVEILTAEGIELATCTYTLRAPGGHVRVEARFESGEWIWPPLRPVARPSTFSPNARLQEDGRLELGALAGA